MATGCQQLRVPAPLCAAASKHAHCSNSVGQVHQHLSTCGGVKATGGRTAFWNATHGSARLRRRWGDAVRNQCTRKWSAGVSSGAWGGDFNESGSERGLHYAQGRTAPHRLRTSPTANPPNKRTSRNAAPPSFGGVSNARRPANQHPGAGRPDNVTVVPAEKSAPIRSIPPDASSEEDSAALPGLEVLEDIFDPRRKPAVREPSNVVLPAVVEPESPPELHILEELLSDGGGAKSHGRDGAARGVVDPIERGRSRGAVKLGSSDTVRSKGAGSSQAGRLVGSLQRRGGPASEGGIEHGNGESTSKEQEGYSRSALEAALRTASGSRGGKGAGGGGGLSRRPSDPPSKELADASPFVKDGRKAQTSYGGGVGKEAEVERGPSKGESKRNGVVGRRAVRTTGSQAGGNSVRVGNRVDTKDSSVPGAWAQWLNSVSERKRAEEQNGVKKNVGMQTGDFEGTRGQEILEGRGLGEGYGVRGGVGRGLERLSGSAAESGQEFGSERGGGSEWGPGRAPQRGWETLPEERGGEVPLRLASREVPGLDDQLESVWSSEGDGEGLQTGRRTFAAGSERNLGYSPEESRTTEDPFLRRRRLQYESLSPSQLFGEEPFDAVATGSGARETGLQSGEGRRQGEVFAGEDVWSVEDDDAVRGKSVGLVQGGSRHAVEKGELEKRGPSRKGAAAIAQRGEGEEIGTGRAWAVDTGLGSNEQAAAGVGSDKQAARKGRLESGLRGGQPAARARSAGERGGSDGGSVSGFEGPPQAARRGRMDVSERQGHVAETEVMKDISERGGDDRKWREAERARSKEKAWAAWLEFSSGGDRSPQEMSQFLAKWTAESVSGENGKEEETWEEPGSASSEAVRRLEGVSGSVTAIGGVEEYGSDADWEGPEGSYSGFAERAASGKVRGAAQRTPGVARSESRGSERGGGVIHKAQSSRGVKEAGRPGVEILGEGKPEGIAYGSREGVLRGGGPDGALGDPRIGGVRTSESTALEGPVNVRQRAGEPPFAAKPSRETWTEKPDASGESQSEADVSAALGTARRGADVSEVRNDGAAARADQGMTSEEALEWGVNEGADPDWVGDDQLGADTWQALEVEDEDDIVQPTETDWQKVFDAAASRRLKRAGREAETEPEPADFPAETAPGGSLRVPFAELSEEEQKELLLRKTLNLSVHNRVQKLKDSRPRKKPRDERSMEERGFAVFLEILPELERQKLLCQKVKSGKLVWAPCCVYYVIHHSHTEILRFFNARTRALARQWKLGYSATKALNYYMRSSCALTLAIKNELKSRAAAYRKWGRELTDPVTRAKFEMKTPIPVGGWDTIDWDRPVGVRAVGGGYYTPEEMRVRTRMVPQPITWKVPTVDDPTLGGKWDLGIQPPERVRQRTKPDGGRRGRR